MATGSGEIQVDPNSRGGNAIGEFFQELIVRVEGEPPIYPISVHLGGDGQR